MRVREVAKTVSPWERARVVRSRPMPEPAPVTVLRGCVRLFVFFSGVEGRWVVLTEPYTRCRHWKLEKTERWM